MVHLLQNYETRMQNLRTLIDEAEASIAQGFVTSYNDPSQLAEEIIARGKTRKIT